MTCSAPCLCFSAASKALFLSLAANSAKHKMTACLTTAWPEWSSAWLAFARSSLACFCCLSQHQHHHHQGLLWQEHRGPEVYAFGEAIAEDAEGHGMPKAARKAEQHSCEWANGEAMDPHLAQEVQQNIQGRISELRKRFATIQFLLSLTGEVISPWGSQSAMV